MAFSNWATIFRRLGSFLYDGLMRAWLAPMSGVRSVLGTAAWALGIAWQTNAASVLGLIGVTVLRGTLPAAVALTARGLINAAVSAVEHGTGFQPLVPWLVVGFVVAMSEAVSPLVNRLFLRYLSDDINLRVSCDVLSHAAKLDIASLEDPRLRDKMDQARHNTTGAFARFVTDLQAISMDIVQVGLLIGVLAYIEPLVLLVVGPFALPYLLFRWRTAQERYTDRIAPVDLALTIAELRDQRAEPGEEQGTQAEELGLHRRQRSRQS